MKNKRNIIILIILLLVYVIASYRIEFNLLTFILSTPGFAAFLATEFFPPTLSSLAKYVQPILGTISAALIASILGSIIAFGLALLVSKKTSPVPWAGHIMRIFLTLFRNIPMLIWATLFTIIVGIGSTAGIVALILFTITFLTRVFADALDNSDSGMIEAMESVGASRLLVLRYGILSAFAPSYYSWLLFVLEINIKASSILGLVGAGGLGYELKKNLDLFRYHEASALILVIVVMLLLIEVISNRIRRILI